MGSNVQEVLRLTQGVDGNQALAVTRFLEEQLRGRQGLGSSGEAFGHVDRPTGNPVILLWRNKEGIEMMRFLGLRSGLERRLNLPSIDGRIEKQRFWGGRSIWQIMRMGFAGELGVWRRD